VIIVVSLVMYVMYVSVDKLTVSARKEKNLSFYAWNYALTLVMVALRPMFAGSQ